MTTNDDKTVDETEIRELMDDWVRALRARDVEAIVSSQAPDVLSFDVVNPLQYVGSDASRRRAEKWLSSFQGPVDLEIRDLSVTVGDDVAFAYSLNRVSGTTVDGGRIDMWLRSTVCYRRINDKWMVTHQHSSVPFDGESGKASLDLKP
jgi:uncharacterized protein (TIGR02246 family)